jgi:hypothetical protein
MPLTRCGHPRRADSTDESAIIQLIRRRVIF